MLTKCPLDVSFYARTGTQQHTSAAFRQNSGVAGAYAPAFVERRAGYQDGDLIRRVSPELMLRPSLSVRGAGRIDDRGAGVAGAYAPAFVERIPMVRGRLR